MAFSRLLLFLAIFPIQTTFAAGFPGKSSTSVDYANLPICFEANTGQADASVQFIAHGQNGALLLLPGEAALMVPGHAGAKDSILRFKLAGANPSPRLEGVGKLPGTVNYFNGADAGQWRTNVTTFAKAEYHDVYPGVDLLYYGNQQKLEYDFVIQPGIDPNLIALDFSDAEKITVDARGDLLLRVNGETIRQHKPLVYQEIDGSRKTLSGDYVLRSGMQVGFQVGAYDKTKPLIIDPVLALATTFGSSGASQANGVAVDQQNNVYITGVTSANNFPAVSAFQSAKPGSQAAFIIKLDTNNAVVYSTYLGGGVTNDMTATVTSALGIAVDGSGHAFVTGFTTTTNFPTRNPFQAAKAAAGFSSRNAFVTELNASGNGLVYSTYLGGSGSDTATGIAVDTNGSAIVTGFVSSTNFPVAQAVQSTNGGGGDAFVTKFSPDGSTLVYSTYLGGTKAENEELSATGLPPLGAIAVDFAGNAYVTGATYSTNFPVLNAFQPTNQTLSAGLYSAVFVTKLDPNGSLVYSTYFGGMQGDLGRAIGVDVLGNVYFAGNSRFGDLPTKNAFQPGYAGRGNGLNTIGDAFVAALDATGTNLLYCTYLGGNGDDQINGLTVRATDGSVAVVGFTDSPNLPVTNAVQSTGFQGILKTSNGGASWSLNNNGITSGIIYSIVIDPSNPATLYALTPAGCFKSLDAGAHWAAANNGLTIFFSPSTIGGGTASLLLIDPLHPATLYAGTFSGVFKTTNGAASWASASTGLPNFPDIQTLAIDPSAPATLYAGTEGSGVYKTTDGGNSWTAVNSGLSAMNVLALLVDPNNSANVYAGLQTFSSARDLFKSTNGGGAWTLLNGGIKGGDVDFLAAGPGNPATIYTVIGDSTGFPVSPILYSSTDGGTTWSNLLQGLNFAFTAFAIGPPALPALSLTRSGSNDLISWPASFAGFVLQTTPSLKPATWQNVAQSPGSTNGNFVVSVPLASSNGFYRLTLSNAPAGRPAFAFSPSDVPPSSTALPPTLYLGTDSTSGIGALSSTDGGQTWIVLGPKGDTIYNVTPDAANSSLYVGLDGGRDCIVATLAPNGQLETCTYAGGGALDSGTAVCSDNATTIYTVGSTSSSDFKTTTSPPDLLPPLAILESAVAENFADAFLQAVEQAWACPESSTKPPYIYHNSGINNLLDFVSFFATGNPKGVPIGLTFTLQASAVQLDGTTSPGNYTFTVDYTEKVPNGLICTWTVTYNIVVLP